MELEGGGGEGVPVAPAPKWSLTSVQLRPEQLERLTEWGWRKRMSKSQIIREAIEMWIDFAGIMEEKVALGVVFLDFVAEHKRRWEKELEEEGSAPPTTLGHLPRVRGGEIVPEDIPEEFRKHTLEQYEMQRGRKRKGPGGGGG